MATTTTTLSAAVAVSDKQITVASATGFAAGNRVVMGSETARVSKAYSSGTIIPLDRGIGGTQVLAHVAGENVTVGVPSDYDANPAQAFTTQPYQRVTVGAYYVASGAISLPKTGEDVIAVLVGTDALTMTLADPGEEQEFASLYVVASGKAAHTVTVTNGLGAGSTSSDVGTFSASYAGGCHLMAINGKWNMVGAGLYSATGATGAPTWA